MPINKHVNVRRHTSGVDMSMFIALCATGSIPWVVLILSARQTQHTGYHSKSTIEGRPVVLFLESGATHEIQPKTLIPCWRTSPFRLLLDTFTRAALRTLRQGDEPLRQSRSCGSILPAAPRMPPTHGHWALIKASHRSSTRITVSPFCNHDQSPGPVIPYFFSQPQVDWITTLESGSSILFNTSLTGVGHSPKDSDNHLTKI